MGNQGLKTFVKEPLCRYKDAIELCSLHETKDYHKRSLEKAEEFKCRYMNPDNDVRNQLDKARQRQIETNRKR